VLALARKPGKSVWIGDDILVTVPAVTSGKATIRFKTQKFIFTECGMLPSPTKNGARVATCHVGACYRIGGNVMVSIARISGGRAIVVVQADPNISIDRDEVRLQKQSEWRRFKSS
jgi:sRNA-binding carbon storage regulator CsrA